ncbi:MAG: PIG-L family deacetylase [Propionibacteriales bacterium]|nr:PIG-L family deacetylase [Propionibacteriales bacterium]
MSWYEAPNALVAHAHPDDETLATGALLAHWVQAGASVHVLTATRGEQGEVVDGPLTALEGTDDLHRHRVGELAGALAELGVTSSAILGEPPARAEGLSPRHYHDSGMRWVTATVAGPSDNDDPLAFSTADFSEAVDDLLAWARTVRPSLLVSYDSHGGYGHPDHVRMHEVTLAAAERSGIPMAEVVHDPTKPYDHWFDLDDQFDRLVRALRHHASQLTVTGHDVVHVGGQRDPIRTGVGLRLLTAG